MAQLMRGAPNIILKPAHPSIRKYLVDDHVMTPVAESDAGKAGCSAVLDSAHLYLINHRVFSCSVQAR